MEIVRISAELFPGAAYWGGVQYEEFKDGESFITEEHRFWLDEEDAIFGNGIDEAAATSPCGVFERSSGEHGEIWFPRPEGAEFVAEGRALGLLRSGGDGIEAYIQPTMAFFFGNSGQVSPLDTEDVEAALSCKFPLGTFPTREEAVEAIRQHNESYK